LVKAGSGGRLRRWREAACRTVPRSFAHRVARVAVADVDEMARDAAARRGETGQGMD